MPSSSIFDIAMRSRSGDRCVETILRPVKADVPVSESGDAQHLTEVY